MIGFCFTTVGEASRSGFLAGVVFAGIASLYWLNGTIKLMRTWQAFVPAETLLQTVGQLAVPPELIGTAASLGAAIRVSHAVLLWHS